MGKNRTFRVAILDEDKMSCYGMRMLVDKTFSGCVLVDTFYIFDELMAASLSKKWDLVITSIDSKEFSILDFLIWLDTLHRNKEEVPRILFSHNFGLNPFPMEIVNFYSHNIFCKTDSIPIFLHMITNILSEKSIAKPNIPSITKAECEVLLELSIQRSVHFLSQTRGNKRKTIYSHKNSALSKLGVKSANHFFATYNRNQVASLMQLSCFIEQSE